MVGFFLSFLFFFLVMWGTCMRECIIGTGIYDGYSIVSE